MVVNYLRGVPKCLDDGEFLEVHMYEINPVEKTDKFFASTFNLDYCKKCKKYLSNKGMIENPKEAILGHRDIKGKETIGEFLGDIDIERIEF